MLLAGELGYHLANSILRRNVVGKRIRRIILKHDGASSGV